MIEFNVPMTPGWGARYREKHGDAVNDDVQVVSPAFRRAISRQVRRAQALRAAVQAPVELTALSGIGATPADTEPAEADASIELVTTA